MPTRVPNPSALVEHLCIELPCNSPRHLLFKPILCSNAQPLVFEVRRSPRRAVISNNGLGNDNAVFASSSSSTSEVMAKTTPAARRPSGVALSEDVLGEKVGGPGDAGGFEDPAREEQWLLQLPV